MEEINKDLFRIALRYIEKGYSRDDLKWGDDLYDSTPEEKEECMEYYDTIEEEGTKWAYKQLN